MKFALPLRGRLLVLALLTLGACTSPTDDEVDATADELTGFSARAVTVTLAYGEYARPPSIDSTSTSAVKFTGAVGDEVEAWVVHWGPGTALLIGPDGRRTLALADPKADYTGDSRIRFKLTRAGTHYVVFRAPSGDASGILFHLEKRGGVLPPSSPAASTDPCIAHPWPMMGQCRDAGYRSNVEGPRTAALAWSTPYSFSASDKLAGIAVGRNGTTHLLHGLHSLVMGYEALVYSAIDAAGRKVVSERFELGDVDRPWLALAADGTPYVFNQFPVSRGTQLGLYDRELFRIDTHGVASSVGNLRVPGQVVLDGRGLLVESAKSRLEPVLRMDAQSRPYVRTFLDKPNELSPYLGNTVRFDPTTRRVELVQPADSGEVAGNDFSNIVVPSGGRLVTAFANVTRTDAAGKHMWSVGAGVGVIATDFAHDHLFVESSEFSRGVRPAWRQWLVYSVATGQLLWKTTMHRSLGRPPLFHPNGDAVFDAAEGSFNRSVQIWSVDGVQKAAAFLPMISSDLDPELALDGAGNTYAIGGNHLLGVDATGATRIDLTMPEAGHRIAIGPDRTILVASRKRLMAFR